MDFRKRKKPCKHIYRLAMELGNFPVPHGHTLPRYNCQDAEWWDKPQEPVHMNTAAATPHVSEPQKPNAIILSRKTQKWKWIGLVAAILLVCAVVFGSQSSRTKPLPAKPPSGHSYQHNIKPRPLSEQRVPTNPKPKNNNNPLQAAHSGKPTKNNNPSPALHGGSPAKSESSQGAYIGNKNSHIFHYPGCRAVQKMRASNMVDFEKRNDATAAGYRPCRICYP